MKIEAPIAVLRGASIENALAKEYRQYLAGRLTREQAHLPCITDDIEVGISRYDVFTADKPHVHPIATEHGYVLQGSIRIKRLDGEQEEYEFCEGDFFVVQKGIPCAAKNAAGTKILFIKSPGINDKTLVAIDKKTETWLSAWDVSL